MFCEEQGVAPAAERDGHDAEATHLLVTQETDLIATCRLLLDAGVVRLGRMVVRADRRGAGVGSTLLEQADRAAVALGARAIRLNAQVGARGVYERAGYEGEGSVFLEEGIEHVTMHKRLA